MLERPPGGRALVRAVLPRRTLLSWKAAGARTDEQIVAANVDVVFVVGALDGGRNLNLRRLERWARTAGGMTATLAVYQGDRKFTMDIE